MAAERLQGKKVFINGSHAVAEYDFGQVCKHYGISCVAGNSSEPQEEEKRFRPRIPGFDIPQVSDKVVESLENLDCNGEEFKDSDFIFIVNPADFQKRIPCFSNFKPVVMYLAGQWVYSQLKELLDFMNWQYDSGFICNIGICCYSKKEFRILRELLRPELHSRIAYVSFFKKLDQYPVGDFEKRKEFIYTSTHAIHKRGKYGKDSMFHKWVRLAVDYNIVLSGMETEEIGGLGCVCFEHLIHNYQTCRCYVSVPAWPAPLVLNMAEAMLCGAPTAFFDNGEGALEEGIFDGGVGCLANSEGLIDEYLHDCCSDTDYAREQSRKCAERARERFDFNKNVIGWGQVLDSLLNEVIQKKS